MSNINTRPFTDPQLLRQIAPEALLQWLAPAREFLLTKGFEFPANPSAIDYERLLDVLAQPEATRPEYLLESIHLVGAMAHEEGRADILHQEERFGLKLQAKEESSPADIALQAWLANPRLLQTMVHEQELRSRRAFLTFVTDQRRLTPFTPPHQEQLDALEKRLDEYYKALKRGKGCKLFIYPSEAEILFFVRHGRPFKRAAALQDGESTTVFYRPQQYDIVIYNIPNDELRMNCCSPREAKVFQRLFGSCLFGDAHYFPGDAKFTLDPLVQKGRQSLVCSDVPGMEEAVLKAVEITHDRGPKHLEHHEAEDVLELVEQSVIAWPKEGRITKATFEIRFRGSGKSRKVTICASNKLLLARDADAPLVHEWLQRRAFTKVEVGI